MSYRNVIQKLTVLPDHPHEVLRGVLEEAHHVLVQRVHVFEQPLVARIVNLKTGKHIQNQNYSNDLPCSEGQALRSLDL